MDTHGINARQSKRNPWSLFRFVNVAIIRLIRVVISKKVCLKFNFTLFSCLLNNQKYTLFTHMLQFFFLIGKKSIERLKDFSEMKINFDSYLVISNFTPHTNTPHSKFNILLLFYNKKRKKLEHGITKQYSLFQKTFTPTLTEQK